ncbi:MAG: hypothetical protein MAG795_01190 [Candidatus Woesearchaeota archaeon]|nr:hypothetical protein [Candidatus Woesearchaeota archaeon]
MKQKQISTIIIILGIVFAAVIYSVKVREDNYIANIVDETGSCYLSDGTCLHKDRNITTYLIGGAVSVAMLFFGLYLRFIDKTQEFLEKHQKQVSKALSKAKKEERKKDEFQAFLAGFEEDEQKILKAVKDQEGIKQSTLRYKTNLSKTAVSLILKSLEEKGFVSRKPSGKTKEVYLVKKF